MRVVVADRRDIVPLARLLLDLMWAAQAALEEAVQEPILERREHPGQQTLVAAVAAEIMMQLALHLQAVQADQA
jgi:hypothetical protein